MSIRYLQAQQGEEMSVQARGGTYRAGECRKSQVHAGKTLGVRRIQRSLSGALHEYPWCGAYSIWLATQGVGAREARCPLGTATSAVVLGLAAICHWPSQPRCSASGSARWQRLRLQYGNSDAGALRGRCGEPRRRTRRRRRIAAEPKVPAVGGAHLICGSSWGIAPRETPFASCRVSSEVL